MEENNQNQNEYVYSTVSKNVYVPPEPPKMRKTPWIIGIILAILVTAGASTGITLWLMRDEQPPVTTETQQQTEENTTEEVTEEATTEEVTTEEVATEEVTTEEVATEEVTTGEVTTEEVTTEEVTTEEVTTEEMTTEEVTPPHVHTEVVLAKVEPTCTKTGLTEGKKCSGCSEILEEQVVVPATGHTPGEEATCTQPQNCTVCNVILSAATGHSFGDWYETKAPTESAQGEKRRDCENCDAFEVFPVAELAHNHNRWDTITLDAVAPTCAATGLTEGKKCSGCSEILEEQVVVPATGHSFDDWYMAKTPTGTEDGEKRRNCKKCDHSEVDSIIPQAFTITSYNRNQIGYVGTTGEALVIPAVFQDGDTWYRVTSIGSYAFHDCTRLTSIDIPDGVTSIGQGAFSGCGRLTSIVISDSVTSIGSYAFDGCSGLISIEIPDSVTSIGNDAFDSCSSLDSVVIGDGVTSIGESAFYGCTGLTSIVIGDGVKSIGKAAFYGCSSLTSIDIPDGVTSIGSHTFCRCAGLTSIAIPDGVTSIDAYTFSGCKSLTSITIPYGVISIGDRAFDGCIGLGSLAIPPSVTDIGFSAFSECSNLVVVDNGVHYVDKWVVDCNILETEVSLREDTVGIADQSFRDCSSLTSIDIPDSVTSIGDWAFYGCEKLINKENGVHYIDKWVVDCDTSEVNVVIREDTVGIAEYAFYVCERLTSVKIFENVKYIGRNAFCKCTSLTSIVIPNSVTSIGEEAFLGCTSLTSIDIGDGVASIGDYAFDGCTGLTSITVAEGNAVHHSDGNCLIETASKTLVVGCKNSIIPDDGSVTRIGEGAFYKCSGLTSINIPDGVTTIGNEAFSYCRGLTSINIPDGVTSIGDYAFYYCPDLSSIDIPDGVTSIGDYAFYYCPDLSSIDIPDGVTSIGDFAFAVCTGLTSIVIPDGVTSIGTSAFNGCSGLTSITFEGTVDQWKSITKGSDWNDEVPATEVICSDGTVPLN